MTFFSSASTSVRKVSRTLRTISRALGRRKWGGRWASHLQTHEGQPRLLLSFGGCVDVKNAQRWEEASDGCWKLSPAVSVLPGFKRCPSSEHLTQGRQTDRWAAVHF